jgi:hypothetical protein
LGHEVLGGAVDGLLRGQLGAGIEGVGTLVPAEYGEHRRLPLRPVPDRVEEVAKEEVEGAIVPIALQ